MVKSMIKNSASFLFQTQKTIISAAGILSLTYAFSAVLSFLRTRILSSYFGDSPELGIFFTADRIPSLIFNILILGTLSSVFIPVFTHYFKKRPGDAWKISSSIVNLSVLAFLPLGILAFIFARELMIAMSFGELSEEQLQLGQNLMRIMLSAQVLLIISSFITSVLQSFKYFLVPSLAPVVYNLGMILGVVLFSHRYGVYAPAIGVIIGALFHLIIQLPLLPRIAFSYVPVIGFKEPGVKEIIKLLPPRILTSSINQISVLIHTSLAVLVSASSVVAFRFAEQLQSFPVNLFGVSIGLAALPTLAYESDDKDYVKFKETFLTSLHQMLFLVIPAAIVLLVLRVPVVRLVYGASKFSWAATIATSYTVAFFSLSIFSQSAVYLVTRAFYALQDTLTPLKVMFFTIFFDILLSIAFVKYFGFGVWSIAFSYSISSILDLLILMFLLHKKVKLFNLEALLDPFLKISYAAVFMGMSLYIPMKILEKYIFDTTRTFPLTILTFTALVFGIVSYLVFTKIFSVKEVDLLYQLIGRIRLRTSIVAATSVAAASSSKPLEEQQV